LRQQDVGYVVRTPTTARPPWSRISCIDIRRK